LSGGDEPDLDRLGIFVLEFKGLHAHALKEKRCAGAKNITGNPFAAGVCKKANLKRRSHGDGDPG
ncbi:MAG: hypothetical protein ACLP9L_20070, partial [Thermoguttaceae bacterium]